MHFKFWPVFISSIKGINGLVSKGMPNIYLEVTIEKNWGSQNFHFLSSKNLSSDLFFGSSHLRRCPSVLKLPLAT